MRNFIRLFSFSSILFLVFIQTSVAASSHLKINHRLYGGTFSDIWKGPFAYIHMDLPNFYEAVCSGTLVTPDKVLTAAHCVAPEDSQGATAISAYTIYVGGEVHKVKQTYWNANYSYTKSLDVDLLYDVGIIQLDTPVLSVKPIPLLANVKLTTQFQGAIYGFGTNENDSTSPFEIGTGAGKQGNIQISAVKDGYFEVKYSQNHVITCHGDSGGGVVGYYKDGTGVLLGVVSQGTSKAPGESCILNQEDYGDYVDVQSKYTHDFFAYFPDITYYTPPQAPTPTPVPYTPTPFPSIPTPIPPTATPLPIVKPFNLTKGEILLSNNRKRLSFKLMAENTTKVAKVFIVLKSGRKQIAKVSLPLLKTGLNKFSLSASKPLPPKLSGSIVVVQASGQYDSYNFRF